MLAKLQDCYRPHIRIWKIWTENANEIGAIIMASYQISEQVKILMWFMYTWNNTSEAFRDVKQNDIEIK